MYVYRMLLKPRYTVYLPVKWQPCYDTMSLENRKCFRVPILQLSSPIRPKPPLRMLRICPENKRCQYRVQEAAPERNARHIMLRSVIFRYEYDVADDVEDSKQHVKPDEEDDGYRGLYREV